MARRWPRLEELTVRWPDKAALEALGAEAWAGLRSLRVKCSMFSNAQLDVPSARALAAALRRMPALRALELTHVGLSDEAFEALFCASSAEFVPQLRALSLQCNGPLHRILANVQLTPAAMRALAATGWRLEELDLHDNESMGAAGVAALVAAPTFALRRLNLALCGLDAAALLSVANAPWPLEELDLLGNDLSAAAAGTALAALSRHRGLRKLNLNCCRLSAAGFKALAEAAWPALTSLEAYKAEVTFSGPHALGAAAFAGFPALEEANFEAVPLGEAGARLLASRRWARLRKLDLRDARLGDAGAAALARGGWPALEELNLIGNGLSDYNISTRLWAPALKELHFEEGETDSEAGEEGDAGGSDESDSAQSF